MTEREDARSGVAPGASKQDRAGGSPVEQRVTRLDTGRPDPMIPENFNGPKRRQVGSGLVALRYGEEESGHGSAHRMAGARPLSPTGKSLSKGLGKDYRQCPEGGSIAISGIP
jgi:hypothetical protein